MFSGSEESWVLLSRGYLDDLVQADELDELDEVAPWATEGDRAAGALRGELQAGQRLDRRQIGCAR